MTPTIQPLEPRRLLAADGFYDSGTFELLRPEVVLDADAQVPSGRDAGSWDLVINLTTEDLPPDQEAMVIDSFAQAEALWENLLRADLTDFQSQFGPTVDDLLIGAFVREIDGPGNVLGSAGPFELRPASDPTPFLPVTGFMQFDSADIGTLLDDRGGQGFTDVVIHEIGHIVGIGTIWDALGLRSGNFDPRFNGAATREFYNALLDADVASVPLEDTGGSGTRGSHWRETTFDNELMTGFYDRDRTNTFSRLSAASLADVGYPEVDLDAAGFYELPANTDAPSRNLAPIIAGLDATADSVTVSGVSDPDGTVAVVEFWQESNGRPGLQRGTSSPDTLLAADATAGDGFAYSGPVAADGDVYARAFDDRGLGSRDAQATPVTDTTAPSVVAGDFEFLTRQAVEFTFDEDVAASLSAGDLAVTNLTTGATVSAGSVSYDAATDTATFAFASLLPDGNYAATLPAGSVADVAGNALASSATVEFFVLAGDFNRDRAVNLADFTALANNFGRASATFAQGDATYDGRVNLADFTVLANRFGATLPPASGGDGLFGDDDR